jgi:hypothetical protein
MYIARYFTNSDCFSEILPILISRITFNLFDEDINMYLDVIY